MNKLIELLPKFIGILGVAVAIFGAFRYFESYSEQNSSAQNNGLSILFTGICLMICILI